MSNIQINSVITEEFLGKLQLLGSADVMKQSLLEHVNNTKIKDFDKVKIQVALESKKTTDAVVIYAYNLKMKYEGFGVIK